MLRRLRQDDGAQGPNGAKLSEGAGFLRWLGLGSWAALVAALLSAIQLLPAVEAAPQLTRAMGVAIGEILATVFPSILGLIGPGWGEGWEDRAGLGVLWVAAAAAAALLCPGRARFEAGVCLLLLAFALGGAALLQGLPGFRLFQIPGRILMLLSLPVALLAGRATQVLIVGAITVDQRSAISEFFCKCWQ